MDGGLPLDRRGLIPAGNEIGTWDFPVQSCQHHVIRAGEAQEVGAGSLGWSSRPARQAGNILVVAEEYKPGRVGLLHAHQK